MGRRGEGSFQSPGLLEFPGQEYSAKNFNVNVQNLLAN